MKQIVHKILANHYLDYQECSSFIHAIAEESISNEHIIAILTGIQMRGIQLEELKGFRSALLELTVPVQIDSNAIDLCGTGGDSKNTFNISTTTSMVLAAMNYKVIKHGNYGVSSLCGSSNVLEQLGFSFSNDSSILQDQLDNQNICFLHAPLFHPTMKKVAAIRTNLGIRTLFNSLGPLVNPIQPTHQMTGTYSLELAKIYHHILKEDRTNYKVVYGLDGYDELTLTNTTRILGPGMDQIHSANTFGIQAIIPGALEGGVSLNESAEIVRSILSGKGTEQQTNVIAANVSEAIQCIEPSTQLLDAFQESKSFILSGQAAKHFKFN